MRSDRFRRPMQEVQHPTLDRKMLVPVKSPAEPATAAAATAPAGGPVTASTPPATPARPTPPDPPAPKPAPKAKEPKPAPKAKEPEAEPKAPDADDADKPWSVQEVDGVGPGRQEELAKAGLVTREAILAAGVDGVSAVVGETLADKIVKAAAGKE